MNIPTYCPSINSNNQEYQIGTVKDRFMKFFLEFSASRSHRSPRPSRSHTSSGPLPVHHLPNQSSRPRPFLYDDYQPPQLLPSRMALIHSSVFNFLPIPINSYLTQTSSTPFSHGTDSNSARIPSISYIISWLTYYWSQQYVFGDRKF